MNEEMGAMSGRKRKVQVHVVRRDPASGEPLFLILRRTATKNQIWQPVTGNVDEGESLDAAALRELAEETGIRDVRLWRVLDSFEFDKGDTVFRETIYLVETTQCAVRLCWEHEAFEWLPYQSARERIYYESNKRGLDLAFQEVMTS